MSIQFRSRIKPAIDYSKVLNSFGVCCGINDTTGVPKSFIECLNEGGYFIPVANGEQNVSCPQVENRMGCCAACAYVNANDLNLIPTDIDTTSPYLTSGFRSNITKCECNRLQGKWTEGQCPSSLSSNSNDSNYWKTYCALNDKDVRIPKACCHLYFDTTTGWPAGTTCTNVCSQNECALKSTDVYSSVYTPNATCNPSTICGTNQYLDYMTRNG